jgi:hypothetical protein
LIKKKGHIYPVQVGCSFLKLYCSESGQTPDAAAKAGSLTKTIPDPPAPPSNGELTPQPPPPPEPVLTVAFVETAPAPDPPDCPAEPDPLPPAPPPA